MQFIHKTTETLSKEGCNKIIEWFENNISLATRGLQGGQPILDNLEIGLSLDINLPQWYGLEDILLKTIEEYKTKFPLIRFPSIANWSINNVCQLMRYLPNDYYSRVHCENDGNAIKRCFAWMIYLNDIKEGGGTRFIHQNTTLQPIAGDMYIWPAGWTHMHHGVNAPKETKYIITGWVSYV
tara:strand:+ start:742 stop:1287 length:546 start_codon:yes stop_codon:yes gene_type:complete